MHDLKNDSKGQRINIDDGRGKLFRKCKQIVDRIRYEWRREWFTTKQTRDSELPSFWNASNPMFLFTIKYQILFKNGTLKNLSYNIFHFEPSSSYNSFQMFAKVRRYKDRQSLKNWKRKKIGSKNGTYRNSYQLIHLDYPVEISKTIPPSSKDPL